MKNKNLRRVLKRSYRLFFVWAILAPMGLFGATVTYSNQTLTDNTNYTNNDTVNILLNSVIIFTGDFGNGTTVLIDSSNATFSGALGNNADITLQNSAYGLFSTLENNANIDVLSGSSVEFTTEVGVNATVSVTDSTVTLGADNLFDNNATLSLEDATLDTAGYDVDFANTSIAGDSTIDVGSGGALLTVDLGLLVLDPASSLSFSEASNVELYWQGSATSAQIANQVTVNGAALVEGDITDPSHDPTLFYSSQLHAGGATPEPSTFSLMVLGLLFARTRWDLRHFFKAL